MTLEAYILLVEGRGGKSKSFELGLVGKGYHVTVAHTGQMAKTILDAHQPGVVIFDGTFFRSNGIRICKLIRSVAPTIPLIYIAPAGEKPPSAISADVILRHPFTIRKLVNRIVRLLPSSNEPTLQAGLLTLYLEKRSLLKGRREHRLTPKQTRLLEVFFRHPGQTLSRCELMKLVWDTDFMDDTRTLDVHIRWVREAVEENPSKPAYITTVRGKGYRFAVPLVEAPHRR